VDRALLIRYLRQLSELGGPDLYLETPQAADALARLLARGPASPRGRDTVPRASVAPSPRPPLPVAPPAVTPSVAFPERLAELARDAAGCTRCRLHEGRRTVVFGEGAATADVVVVGEAPGQDEDRTGRPFVGRAGRMLDLLLLAAGFPRETVFICNVLKCRPPNNRDPLPDEVAMCTSRYLHAQLEIIAPRVLLAVGKFAAQTLLQSEDPIGRLRGRVHSYRGTPLVVSYHPAFLLRTPQMARTAWDDFQLMRKVLDEQV
jgi:DNA polymerase